jgi:glycine betaine/proline transport system ATP-binding protein
MPREGVLRLTLTEGVLRLTLTEIRRRKIAMVFHPFSLFPHSSIVVNAASGLRVQGVPADEHRERAMAVLERSSTGTSKSLAGKSSG